MVLLPPYHILTVIWYCGLSQGLPQLTMDLPCFRRYWLVWVKCPLSINRVTENGDGCPHWRTKCLSESMNLVLAPALAPHSKNTRFDLVRLVCSISSSVTPGQPKASWEPGFPSSTVSEVLSSNTPCFAQLNRSLFGTEPI